MEEYTSALPLYERLFLDPEKDVTFHLADGTETAHRSILKAASEVWAGMFTQNMRENAEGTVALPDVKRVPFRVFLRLIYTGRVDASDWGEQEGQPNGLKILRMKNISTASDTLTSTADGWTSAALLDLGGSSEFEITVNVEDHSKFNFMLGIAPVDANIDISHLSGFYALCSAGNFSTLYNHTDDVFASMTGTWPNPLPANSTISMKFVGGKLLFSVNGSALVTAEFNGPIPAGNYTAAIFLRETPRSIRMTYVGSSIVPPLEVLLTVASLAKKYMVGTVLSMVTQALKGRLQTALCSECIDAFEEILAAAIRADMGAVRMAAMDGARTSKELRRSYDEKRLRPEIMYELEALWPPAGPRGKSARLK